jgi:hypothetical protein
MAETPLVVRIPSVGIGSGSVDACAIRFLLLYIAILLQLLQQSVSIFPDGTVWQTG